MATLTRENVERIVEEAWKKRKRPDFCSKCNTPSPKLKAKFDFSDVGNFLTKKVVT